MSRTDRQLAIVVELQAHGWRRAEDLAHALETSKRTIYRDLVALGIAGVPIISTPGRGYSLVEGYFLPPVSFTADEATMLLLGADVMAQNFDAQYRAAAGSAATKLTAALPERLRADVAALRERIQFGALGASLSPALAATLRALRGAVIARQTIRFRYHTRYPSDQRQPPARPDASAIPQSALRDADPYALAHLRGAWYLTAYCHLRHGMRHFRLDRIEDLTILDQGFTRPASLPPIERIHDSPNAIEIHAHIDAASARWVRESPNFFTTTLEDAPDGGLNITLRVRHEDEIIQWILSWGSHIRILAPASLRQRLAAEAAVMLAAHTDAERSWR